MASRSSSATDLIDDIHFHAARAELDRLAERLRSAEIGRMQHSEVEALVEREGREVLRLMFQAYLTVTASREEGRPVAGADGIERPYRRRTGRALTTVFGDVEVSRLHMTARGAAGGLHPLDAELNVPPEQQSHHVQRRVGWLAANEPFDAVVASLEETCGAHVAKRQVEYLARRSAEDFDAFYAQTAASAVASGHLLVMSFDGKGIVMRPEDLRPATRRAAAGKSPRLQHRTSPGEKRGRKRMAQVATVYALAAQARTADDIVAEFDGQHPPRPRPQDKRIWASVEREPVDVIRDAFQEALQRDPKKQRKWVVLVDGNGEQLKLVRAEAKRIGVTPTFVLDVVHVLEYLWSAAWCLFSKGDPAAEAWVTERLRRLLEGGVSSVAAGIRRSATKRDLAPDVRHAMDKCADYLLKYKAMLRYDEYLAAGMPIATGVIEGACRHLIKDRMDITGARWSLEGAEAVLRLRSLRSSGDFDAYWDFHLRQERERHHLRRYAAHELTHLREAA
jgi:hypothetical protein